MGTKNEPDVGKRRVGDLETELKQLAMDTRGSPEWIVYAYFPDERAYIGPNGRPPSPSPRFPAPVKAETRPMPAHDCLRSDDHHRLDNRRKPSIQQNEERQITVGKLDPAPLNLC